MWAWLLGMAMAGPAGIGLMRDGEKAAAEAKIGPVDRHTTYLIDQAIDDVGGTFSGYATIRWTNPLKEPVRVLPLRLYSNAANEQGVPGQNGGIGVFEVLAKDSPPLQWQEMGPTRIDVTFVRPVMPGEQVAIDVRYSGRLRMLPGNVNDALAASMQAMGSLQGTGAADYGLLAQGDGILTAASAYPMVAPIGENGFETPAPGKVGDLAWNEMSTFQVRTVVPEGVTVYTNLVDGPMTPLSAGSSVVVSDGILVRDFVLVAGRDLATVEQDVGGVRVRSIFRGRDSEAGGRALTVAAAALQSYERRFGRYPYKELDVAEASLVGGAGGVEFCGMVLIAGMLYRPIETSTSPLAGLMKMWSGLGRGMTLDGDPRAQAAPEEADALLDDMLEFTVQHEVAHQWFAGIVGNDARHYPTVDEPLAQYAAGLAYEDAHGADAAARAMDHNVKLNYALYRALGGQDRVVAREVGQYRSGIEYAALVYGKAPYLYVSLRKDLGDAATNKAIAAAVARWRYGVATTKQWEDAIAAGAGSKSAIVHDTFRGYLDETKGDAQLGVDDSGDFVFRALFPPEVSDSLDQSMGVLGMQKHDLLRMMFGGAIADDAPFGAGIDPDAALRQLQGDGVK